MRRTARIATTLGFLCAAYCHADEFRIDSMVFAADEEDALCRSTSRFVDQMSYDQVGSDGEVVILDFEQARITLLDLAAKHRAHLSFTEVMDIVQAMKERVGEAHALARFAADPKFEILNEPSKRLIRLTAEPLSYRVETLAAPSATVSQQYRVFADWTARLNALRPGLPPAARIVLNEQLAVQQQLPTVVAMTTRQDGNTQKYSSRHDYTWSLNEQDRQQITQFDEWATRFKEVDPFRMLTGDSR